MSFLKRLFGGGGGSQDAEGAPAKQIEHKGFTIAATPYKNDGQYQTCGVVSKRTMPAPQTRKIGARCEASCAAKAPSKS